MKKILSLFLYSLTLTSSISFADSVFLDNNFGTDGTFLFEQTLGSDIISSIHILPNDQMLIGGSSSHYDYNLSAVMNQVMLLQLDPQGNLNPIFNNSGFNLVDLAPNAGTEFTKSIFTINDNIIVATKIDESFNLVYFNLDGTLDTTMGSNGLVEIEMTNYFADFVTAKMDHLGRIILAGYCLPDTFITPCFARVFADGSIDSSFADNGIYLRKSKYDETLTDIAIATNNDIYFSTNITHHNFKTGQSIIKSAINKLLEKGAIDYNFGEIKGKTLIPLTEQPVESNAILVDHFKNTYILGRYLKNTTDINYDLYVAKVKANGQLDNTFGINGVKKLDLNYMMEYGSSLLLDKNNQLLMGGYVESIDPILDTKAPKKFIARLNASGNLDTNFNNNGIFYINEPGTLQTMQFDKNDNLIIGGTYKVSPGEQNASIARILIDATQVPMALLAQ